MDFSRDAVFQFRRYVRRGADVYVKGEIAFIQLAPYYSFGAEVIPQSL